MFTTKCEQKKIADDPIRWWQNMITIKRLHKSKAHKTNVKKSDNATNKIR